MEEAASQPLLAPTTSFKEKILKYKPFIGIGLVILLVILISLLAYFASRQLPGSQKPPVISAPETNTPNYPTLSSANLNLTFGVLTKDSATIKSYSLSEQKEMVLATLPSNIKKVTPLKDGRLLYINKTNDQDHGEEIAVYGSDKKTTTVFRATEGFGIDDYVISPNEQYLATWEVKFSANSSVLAGGYSRVYSFSLASPTEGKHLIYDEDEVNDSRKPFHYPRAVNDSGEIFCDQFLPNDGAGWAYGMSISDFKGTKKEELDSMKNGSYGTQPILSPDGNFLAFAGYDGAKGSGTDLVEGFRRALISPNSLELFDINAKKRVKLANVSDQLSYNFVDFDKGGNNLIYNTLSGDANVSGLYLYNLKTNTTQKILSQTLTGKHIISSLSQTQVLIGNPNLSATTLANLGDTYASSYNSFALFNIADKSETPIQLSDQLVQFIKLSPIDQSSNQVLGTKIAQGGKQIQIKTLVIPPKPSLEPIRTCQQSGTCPSTAPSSVPPAYVYPTPSYTYPTPGVSYTYPTPYSYPTPSYPTPAYPTPGGGNTSRPRCDSINAVQCASAAGIPTSFISICKSSSYGSQCEMGINQVVPGGFVAYTSCLYNSSTPSRPCSDSPLYLYGPTGLSVQVRIHTPISNSNLDDNGNFTLTLAGNNGFKFNNQIYQSLVFDYTPALRKINPPKGGKIVAINDLPATLRDFAKKLGMNDRETTDLVKSASQQISAPYVLVSFFDQETSEKILPITFNPMPASYLNYIFYFKPLPTRPSYTIGLPNFPQILKREPFTAIEISTIIDQ